MTVRIVGHDRDFRCASGQSVLAALSPVHRLKIASGCRGGGCGVCKVRIVEGAYTAGPMSASHVTAEDRERGVVLACRAYPEGDVVVEVLGNVF